MAKRRAFGSIIRRKNRCGVRSKEFTIRYKDPSGRERWESGFVSRNDAERRLVDIRGSIMRYEKFGERDLRELSLAQFRSEFEASRTMLSAQTRASDSSRYDYLETSFGAKRLHTIRAADIENFMGQLALRKRCKCKVPKTCTHPDTKPATLNRYLNLLSTIFNAAIKRGCVAENPCTGIKRRTEVAPDVVVLSSQDLGRVAARLPSSLRDAFTLACETGARRGELAALTWADVDMSAAPYGALLIRKGKSARARRAIPLTAVARHVVRRLRETRAPITIAGPAPLLPELAAPWALDRFSKAVPKASHAAGFSRLRLHDCRHLYAVRMLRAGVPLSDVAVLLGDTLEVATRYMRHVPGNSGTVAVATLEASERRALVASGQ